MRARHTRLLAEVAVYSLVVLILTGVFLLFHFDPDMTQVVYNGSYTPLRDVPASKAFASTLAVSLEVRGGLLVRQLHHWATLVFVAAICLYLLGLFFTGVFRRTWVIWIGLLTLSMAAGVTGSILPDDMLSGGSLGLIQGVTQSIPLVGTFLTGLMFGDGVPGDRIIPVFYWLHVLLLPAVMVGMLAVGRRSFTRHRYSPALFFATCGVLALLATVAQINPIWLYGPYRPGVISSGAVPGWYMGFLDGALRIMPAWEPVVGGHPVSLSILIPALVVPGAFFTVLAAYPLLDRRISRAARNAVGAAGMTFYVVLWAAASNDQLAYYFHLSLFAVTWFFRVAVFVAPAVAFEVTRRLCLALRQQEREEAEHGVETGSVSRTPEGEYIEEHTYA
ncbi:cytochrome bc complex cytochrome b subunit [Nonomuraea sp. NPDC050556]|uniref:cytochrome bc complex cytochrome b subunit n=1 Tax=Nonomuraea sp. NPDC050556 TaxID=3364369 RepID=UPI0037B8C56B